MDVVNADLIDRAALRARFAARALVCAAEDLHEAASEDPGVDDAATMVSDEVMRVLRLAEAIKDCQLTTRR